MPAGTHKGVRVALAVPPKIYEQLKVWSDWEGRPVASLCMYLIEQSLRQAQREGIAPSYDKEGKEIESWRDERQFNGWKTERVMTNTRSKEPEPEMSRADKMDKLAKLLEMI